MKKLTYLFVSGAILLSGNCFGMDPIPVIAAPGPNIASMKQGIAVRDQAIRDIHAEGDRKIVDAMIFAPPVSVRLLAQNQEARDLRMQLSLLSGVLQLGDTLLGSDDATPPYSGDNAAGDLNVTAMLLAFLDSHAHNGGAHHGAHAPATLDAAPTADSIFSHWAAFAGALGNAAGNSGAPAKTAAFRIEAKGDNGDAATDREKDLLVAGLTVANLTHGASVMTIVGANAQDCLWMGLLANVALAEHGTLDTTQLDGGAHAAMGYTPEIRRNIKAILAALT